MEKRNYKRAYWHGVKYHYYAGIKNKWFETPDYWGIGKSLSRGFKTIINNYAVVEGFKKGKS
jgi:hypothetical protein